MSVLITTTSQRQVRYDPHSSGRFRNVMEEMERILEDIHHLPGYESFLLPPKSSDLMAMATDGPIVVIILSSIINPGVAITVRSSGISSLQLPKLNHVDATD
jgi:hypothetical protein